MSAEEAPASSKRPFGLSFPSRPKTQTTVKPTVVSKSCLAAAAFSMDDDEDDDNQSKNTLTAKTSKPPAIHPKAQRDIEQALEENPQIYEYDEVYEEISSTVQQEKRREETRRLERETNVVRQPKYIHGLLEKSKQREKEYERIKERQIERERAEEGDKYADKEVIVTPAYKAKLAERQADLEREKLEEQREALLNVMHQDNMDAFYRFQFKLRTGEATILEESEKRKTSARQLRKRDDQDDDDPNETTGNAQMYARAREKPVKREETNDGEEEAIAALAEAPRTISKPVKVRRVNDESSQVFDDEQVQLGVGAAAKKKQEEEKRRETKENEATVAMPLAEEKKRQAKESRIERIRRLCEKRTVGEALEKAQQAYFEREQRRSFLKDYIERAAE